MAITAAELIARISVQGMSQFTSSMQSAEASFSRLGSIASQVSTAIAASMAAATGGLAIFTQNSINEAMKVERLTVSFGALFHSMSMGRQEIEFLRGVAKHTVTDLDDLAAASLRLTSTGLNSGRFIQMADMLGQLITPGSSQGMMEIADALGRISSGQNMGMAMRQIGRFISYNDLRGEGVKISGNNHIESSSEQVLTAIESVFKKKFGDLGQYLDGTMTTEFSNLQDAWNKLMDSWGKAWFPLIRSILDSITPFLNFLTDSGEVNKIAASFASLFDGMKDGGWVRILMFGVAILEDLPNILRSVWSYVSEFMIGFGKLIGGFVDVVVEGIGRMVDTLHDLEPVIRRIGDAAMAIGGALGVNGAGGSERPMIRSGFPNPIDYFREHWGSAYRPNAASGAASRLAGMGNSVASAMGGSGAPQSRNAIEDFLAQLPRVGDIFQRASSRTDELMAQFDRYMKTATTDAANPEGNGLYNKNHVADANSDLSQIRQNTANMAAHMVDYKRYALGGGDFSQRGVSIAEFYGSSGPMHNGPIQVDVRSGNAKLDEALGDMFMNFTQQLHRRTGRRQ